MQPAILLPGKSVSAGHRIEDAFNMKMPAFADDEDAFTKISGERHLVSPEIIAYVKWLIYTAAFKEPL